MAPAHSRREEARFLLLVMLAGLVLRLIWLSLVFGPFSGFYTAGEASNVAIAVSEGKGIADAYFPGQGPTAHLLPVNPAIAGFVLWLFGADRSITHLTLLGWSLAQTVAAFLLLRAVFTALGSKPIVARWGTAMLCLLTPFAAQEVIDFRYWESGSALCLAALNLLLIVRCEQRSGFDWLAMTGIATLTAFTFFVSPPVGLAVDACWGWFALRRLSFPRAAGFALMSAAMLGAFLTPWTIRNIRVLNEPVLLRSNFGLELAVANHAAALSTRTPAITFADRLLKVHPFQKNGRGPTEYRATGGEIAYSRMLGIDTKNWIASHPLDFARLTLRHLSEFFFPRPWQMYFTGWEGMRTPRALIICLVSFLGLAELAAGLWRRQRGYVMLAIYIGVTAAPYSVLQPTSRYIYLVYGVLMFLAVTAAVRSASYVRNNGLGWAR